MCAEPEFVITYQRDSWAIHVYSFQMSFNGRLNPLLSLSSSGSETATAMTASTLSLNSEAYFGMAAAAAASAGDDSGTTAVLCERLSACQSALASKERTLRRLRAEQEEQLGSLCRQMMSFECGLRRKQRELEAALSQRDRIIREQNAVIRFLMRKTGTKTRNISKLRSEAIAKIPQIVDVTEEASVAAAPTVVSIEASPNVCGGTKDTPSAPLTMNQPTTTTATPPRQQQHLTTIRLNGELSSIVESASENGGDSDSAIILDDSVSSSASASLKSNNSTSGGSTASCSSTAANIAGPSSMSSMNALRLKRISRSVSDVVTAGSDGNVNSPEASEENYLHPPGSDERCPQSEVRNACGRSRVVKLVDDEDGDLSDDYSTVEEEVDEQRDDDSGSGGGGNGAPFDSSHYRGFLLRHGSFERYKKSAKSGGGSTSSSSATDEQGVVVTVNGGGGGGYGGGGGKVPSINHRSVTKPRDIKNRRAKLGMHGLAARGGNVPGGGAANPAAMVPNVSESIRSFVEKRGSVYKSVFLEQGPVSHSFA